MALNTERYRIIVVDQIFYFANFFRIIHHQLIDISNNSGAGRHTKRLDPMITAHRLILILDKIVISKNM